MCSAERFCVVAGPISSQWSAAWAAGSWLARRPSERTLGPCSCGLLSSRRPALACPPGSRADSQRLGDGMQGLLGHRLGEDTMSPPPHCGGQHKSRGWPGHKHEEMGCTAKRDESQSHMAERGVTVALLQAPFHRSAALRPGDKDPGKGRDSVSVERRTVDTNSWHFL